MWLRSFHYNRCWSHQWEAASTGELQNKHPGSCGMSVDRASDPCSPSDPISLSPAAWTCRWLKGKLHSCQRATCCMKVNFVVSCKIGCFKICSRNYLNALPLGEAAPVCQALEGCLHLWIAHCCCSDACCADFLVLVNTAQESGFTVKCAVSNRAII